MRNIKPYKLFESNNVEEIPLDEAPDEESDFIKPAPFHLEEIEEILKILKVKEEFNDDGNKSYFKVTISLKEEYHLDPVNNKKDLYEILRLNPPPDKLEFESPLHGIFIDKYEDDWFYVFHLRGKDKYGLGRITTCYKCSEIDGVLSIIKYLTR